MNNKRISSYDIAKGIGILLVIVGHSVKLGSIRVWIYSFHMPLFFVLSGLVMKPDIDTDLKKFISDNKFLIINYFIFSGIYICFDFIVRFHILHIYSFMTIIKELYMMMSMFGINVMWFISTLVLGKILVYMVAKRWAKSGEKILIALIFFIFSSTVSAFLFDNIPENMVLVLIYYPVVAMIRTIMMSAFIIIGFALKDNVRKIMLSIPSWVGGRRNSRVDIYNIS